MLKRQHRTLVHLGVFYSQVTQGPVTTGGLSFKIINYLYGNSTIIYEIV